MGTNQVDRIFYNTGQPVQKVTYYLSSCPIITNERFGIDSNPKHNDSASSVLYEPFCGASPRKCSAPTLLSTNGVSHDCSTLLDSINEHHDARGTDALRHTETPYRLDNPLSSSTTLHTHCFPDSPTIHTTLEIFIFIPSPSTSY